jgi:hypothetical protein
LFINAFCGAKVARIQGFYAKKGAASVGYRMNLSLFWYSKHLRADLHVWHIKTGVQAYNPNFHAE